MARSIKDEVDPAALSLSGARLLQLLEPFLESLVPVEVVAMMCMCENNFLSYFLACLFLSKCHFMFPFQIMSLTKSCPNYQAFVKSIYSDCQLSRYLHQSADDNDRLLLKN